MIILAKTLFLLSLGVLLHQRVRTLLTYFQQEEYDNRRYFGAWLAVRLFDLRATAGTLVACGLTVIGVSESALLILLSCGYAAICFQESRYRYKKPLAMTERALRLYRLAFAIILLPVLLAAAFWPLALIALQVGPVALVIANAVLQPFQRRINDGFVTEARDKLARMDPVRIGITGSFGKTTVKHILAEVLEVSGPVFYSRGSINTILGLTRHIRQRLQWGHRYFIAEMGAYGIGSIDRLCAFAKPNYGIVTAVGDAHTERFGSVEIIAQAKSELVADVCGRGGKVVLNADVLKFEPFRKLKSEYGAQILSVGKDDSDICLTSKALQGGGWCITLTWADGTVSEVTYELPLIGDHNIMNSALAVALTLTIDPTLRHEISSFTKSVSQIPHRLQKIDNPGSALILDDAYNANEIGFKSAVVTLNELAKNRGGRAILVTPGIAELGPEHGPVHDRLGDTVNTYCDSVYVVNPDRIPSFAGKLDRSKLDVVDVSSFFEARKALATDLKPDDVVLYENDLPDLLEETRRL